MNTSDLLDRYNAWRKGEIDTWRPDSNEGPSPKDITAAIAEGAAAIRELATLRAELYRLRKASGEAVAAGRYMCKTHGHYIGKKYDCADCMVYTHPAPQDDARDALVKAAEELRDNLYVNDYGDWAVMSGYDVYPLDAAILAAKVKP